MSDFLNGNGYDLSGGASGVTANADNGGLVFDLTGVEEEKGFEIIPKGTYNAIVDEIEFGESKAGNPMMTVKYQITDAEYENRVLFDYWVLQGKGSEFGMSKLKKFLVRVCPDVNIAAFNPAEFANNGEGVGRICQIVLGIQTQKQGEYKGEKRNTVKDVLAPAGNSFL